MLPLALRLAAGQEIDQRVERFGLGQGAFAFEGHRARAFAVELRRIDRQTLRPDE